MKFKKMYFRNLTKIDQTHKHVYLKVKLGIFLESINVIHVNRQKDIKSVILDIFHVKGLIRFTFYVKLMDDRRKT